MCSMSSSCSKSWLWIRLLLNCSDKPVDFVGMPVKVEVEDDAALGRRSVEVGEPSCL